LEELLLIEFEKSESNLEEEGTAVVGAEYDVPHTEQSFGRKAVCEDGEEPLEGKSFELDA